MDDIIEHRYAVAEPSGRIAWVSKGPYLYVACDDTVRDDTHYVDVATGEIQPKRPLEMHQGIEALKVTLAGLPAGLTVATNGMDTVTDGTPLVITYDLPGTYEIRLSGHIEYLDRVEEVTVDDA
ncbi:hypothetical protein [Halomonas sp. BMC6]|uniref:hypothetical protein n=1 Tax=Halomonas sp. BMC6 TaxID=3073244 RepID=UPI0030D081CC